MSMAGVLRPGHVQLRVLDLEESVRWYSNVFGLIETGRDKFGRVYFKCWDERDHHSVILRKAERAGMDFYGFRVLDVATPNKLERHGLRRCLRDSG
jgi:catechol 2,3-dioxygenase